jgi:DMSO reductase family type II enzyme chaperone
LFTDRRIDDPALTAQARGEIYKLLALCFYEPTQELANDIAQGSLASALRSPLESIGTEGWEESIAAVAGCRDQPDGLDAERLYSSLKAEYTRLFIGPGHVPVPPYESVHRQDAPEFERGLVMGRSTVDARRRYAEAGLQLSSDFTDLPDHIAVELEFMYFLCTKEAEAWQAQDSQTALRRRAAQCAFLSQHLGKWVPVFCDAITQAAQEGFYRGLVRLTQAYIEKECNWVAMLAGAAESGASLAGS